MASEKSGIVVALFATLVVLSVGFVSAASFGDWVKGFFGADETQLALSPSDIEDLDEFPTAQGVTINAYLMANSTEDRAGVWNVFGPGAGSRVAADWQWTLTFDITGNNKTIKGIEVLHKNGEFWNTIDSYYYPLVVFRGPATQQLNTQYNQQLGTYERGSHYLRLYGQRETQPFQGATVYVRFTDGTTAFTEVIISSATTDSCTDSDGNNFNFKGTVTWINSTGNYTLNDRCHPNVASTAIDYVCANNLPQTTAFACPYGCSDGACLQSNTTTQANGTLQAYIRDAATNTTISGSTLYVFKPGVGLIGSVMSPGSVHVFSAAPGTYLGLALAPNYTNTSFVFSLASGQQTLQSVMMNRTQIISEAVCIDSDGENLGVRGTTNGTFSETARGVDEVEILSSTTARLNVAGEWKNIIVGYGYFTSWGRFVVDSISLTDQSVRITWTNTFDRCTDSSNVLEYTCLDGNIRGTVHACSAGFTCYGGACIEGTNTSQPVCMDSDGGLNYEVRGIVNGQFVETARGNDVIVFNASRAAILVGNRWMNVSLLGNYSADIGKFTVTKINTTDPNVEITYTTLVDTCSEGLIEYWCAPDGQARGSRYTCPNGCQDGVCIKDPVQTCDNGCYSNDMGRCVPYGTRFDQDADKEVASINQKMDLSAGGQICQVTPILITASSVQLRVPSTPSTDKVIEVSEGSSFSCGDIQVEVVDTNENLNQVRLTAVVKNVYCQYDGGVKMQLGVEATCQNNYECASNQCSNGACVEVVSGFQRFVGNILCSIKNPISSEERKACLEEFLGITPAPSSGGGGGGGGSGNSSSG